jgi:hypothetical protein
MMLQRLEAFVLRLRSFAFMASILLNVVHRV